MSTANSVLKHILGKGLYDDRRQYDVDDLMSSYNLDRKEAKKLYKALHKK